MQWSVGVELESGRPHIIIWRKRENQIMPISIVV